MKTSLINFLFEAATLKRLKRTGWQILGDNDESIAEHSFMVCVISFVLAEELGADVQKVLLMALFHDFEEARTGDVYRLADLYTKVDKKKASLDAFSNLRNSAKITGLQQEYDNRQTLEAKIVKDSDTLALCLELKQLIEKGNINAKVWLDSNIKALKLDRSKKLAEEIVNTNSQDWWKNERGRIALRLFGALAKKRSIRR